MHQATLIASLCLLTLTACASGPSFTHAKKLTNSTGTALYDCGSLDVSKAGRAVDTAHHIFETKHYKTLKDLHAENAKLRAEFDISHRNLTRGQVTAHNEKASQLRYAIHSGIAKTGCEFIGLIRDTSVKP